MRIGIYASAVGSERGHERNVSAHIQLPVHTLQLLRDAGHDAHLVTTRFGPEHVLPAVIPDDVPVHLVEEGRRRPKKRRGGGKKKGVRPVGLIRQLHQMKTLARRERWDALHVFGLSRTALLGGLVKTIGLDVPVIATLVAGNLPPQPGRLPRYLLGRLDAIIASTDYAAGQVRALGHEVSVIRHGVIRDLVRELVERHPESTPGPRHRVLFWRDPNLMNGADLCVEAFGRLAPDFPEYSFDLAIRPTQTEVPGIAELEAAHDNVHVFRFPYSDGVSLPLLMAESTLVVLPFRKLTVDPQLSTAESLAAGVPVVTSDVRSNVELVEDGVTGAIVPLDAGAIEASIRALLQDPARLEQMRAGTAARFTHRWNWDQYVDDLVAVYERTAR